MRAVRVVRLLTRQPFVAVVALLDLDGDIEPGEELVVVLDDEVLEEGVEGTDEHEEEARGKDIVAEDAADDLHGSGREGGLELRTLDDDLIEDCGRAVKQLPCLSYEPVHERWMNECVSVRDECGWRMRCAIRGERRREER